MKGITVDSLLPNKKEISHDFDRKKGIETTDNKRRARKQRVNKMKLIGDTAAKKWLQRTNKDNKDRM